MKGGKACAGPWSFSLLRWRPHLREGASSPLFHLPTPDSGYRLFQLLPWLPPQALLTLLSKELRFHGVSQAGHSAWALPTPIPGLQHL